LAAAHTFAIVHLFKVTFRKSARLSHAAMSMAVRQLSKPV